MYWSLIKKFFKEKGRFPIGKELDDIKKLSGDMEFRQKLLRFPEEKITDYTKDRPTEGPKAEVKKFPTKNKPATQTYSLDFLDLLEDFNKIKANNKKTKKSMFELMDDLQALTKEYKKTETKKITTSDFLRDYFDLPNPQQKRNVTELNGIELFGDETFEELDIINKTGKHPRDKKAEGGKIGFAQGANKKMMIVDLLNKGADLDLIKTITEASDEEIMEAVDFFKYGGAGVPLPTFDESGKMIDDGLYKGRETRPEAKAYGGRIGFSAGGIDKARRGFLKLLGAGAGAAVTAKTGLFGLMKGGKKTADVAKVATKVAGVAPNQPPSYLFDLVKVIRAKGKDITKANQTIERETVKIYKGVELHENPDGFRIKAEGVSPYEGGKEIELMYSKTEEVKDLGLETQKSFKVTDYEEVTVRPDPDGKMKDVEFYVDEKDHNKLKKIVEDEKKFKTGGRVLLSTGGLAKLLGE